MLIFVVTALQCALEGGERICQKGIYCKSWKFTFSDGRFEMDFLPILDRSACLDYKLIVSDQHQVFGRMSGMAVLDDGTKIEIKDVLCFAEKVHNRY